MLRNLDEGVTDWLLYLELCRLPSGQVVQLNSLLSSILLLALNAEDLDEVGERVAFLSGAASRGSGLFSLSIQYHLSVGLRIL
jgi:hypothetical protein